MTNPKTTIAGYVLILIAVSQILVHILHGEYNIADHVQELLTAVAGLGLIAAKDGGH